MERNTHKLTVPFETLTSVASSICINIYRYIYINYIHVCSVNIHMYIVHEDADSEIRLVALIQRAKGHIFLPNTGIAL